MVVRVPNSYPTTSTCIEWKRVNVFAVQKLAKREAGTIDRSQDIARLQEFYKSYREKHNVDKLREEEMKLRESGAFSRDLGELERKTVKRKRVFATLKVLGTVLEQLSEEIPDELKRVMDSDSALTEDLVAYNIIPLDASSSTNAIVYFPEVQAAVSALKYFNGLPELPRGYFLQPTRNANMFDFLQCTFGFQSCGSAVNRITQMVCVLQTESQSLEKSAVHTDREERKLSHNVANQHEHIVHLLANEQSRLRIPEGAEPKLDEVAVQEIFLKSLQNYIKWCDYLGIQPVWSSLEAVSKEKKLLYVSLYFLIWGEASNIRFLPECLCYIYHH
ncbi:Callose synthase 9 [Glycine soja]|uniref:Callose synthase 9 n=1 Tax=Glycine soja TaxID=3848 RepID=A0A0B2QZJ0_GLYSO|nr:Callose synthase 9 [Glycine soja]